MADITVESNALPLQLYLKIAKQPSAASLPLTLSAKLGEFTKLYFAAALPLPLTQKISEQPPSNRLPLALNRKLGTLDAVIVTPTDPTDPTTPKRTISGVSIAMQGSTSAAVDIAKRNNNLQLAITIAETARAYRQMGITVADDYYSLLKPFINLGNATATEYSDVVNLANQFDSYWYQYVLLANATRVNVSDTVGLATVLINDSASAVSFDKQQFEPQQPAVGLATSLTNNEHGMFVGNRSQSRTQAAVPVPWRYYAIPDDTPPPIVGACRIRPPSSRLPLALTRKRNGLPSSQLPLALTCWHDQAPAFVPDLRSYIVLNTVTATLGGIAIDPIDFNIKTDLDSYCWQGGIKISDKQYQKVKAKLDVARGSEPLVIVTVNGVSYSFIAEEISRNRVFGNYSYSISGRSSTAQLGKDYAHSQGGTINQDLYASQIINMQLADLPFSIDRFEVTDWLIPAGTLNTSNQTPISIISQIAQACGAEAISDPLEPKLSIIPRWKKPAWEMATATADLVIPMGVVQSISDQKRVNPRYNTVTLIGRTQGSEVYRAREGRNLIAPVANWYLYTDRDCVIPRGIQILSDSGTHGLYTLKIRVADKYNMPLVELGQILQISDPEGAWKGIVTGVSLDVGRDNDAITVWQTVNIDRYLDV
ncbi:hypothetical protein MOXK02_19120 [Moraxella sp. K02]